MEENEVTELENQEVLTEEAPKTFTQEELDAIVKKRLAREAKKYKQETKIVVSDKPTLQEGESQEDYLEKLLDWKESQKQAAKLGEKAQQEHELFSERSEKAYSNAEKIPGFDRDKFDSYLEDYEGDIAKEAIRALVESDQNAQLMAYMTANPKEFEKLAELSPARQAAYIGKLETKLEKQTQALPKPPEKEKGATTTSLYKSAPDKMSTDEWYAERQRERLTRYK